MSDPSLTETRALSAEELKLVLEAEHSGLPFVHWRERGGAAHVHLLEESSWRVTIGRNPDSEIALIQDPEVSRTHALLERVGDQWTLVDDGLSRNGSFVNGGRVLARQRLHDRDRLTFGQTQLVYREPPGAGDEESTQRVSDQAAAIPLSTMQRKVLIALCRPVNESPFATPATNKQIADEVFLSVDAVKAHLRVLFDRFGIGELPQNEKRARLAARALTDGVLRPQDF
jgi:pSer/pThr/pTyr-binding forkhead associated (FHA) protein